MKRIATINIVLIFVYLLANFLTLLFIDDRINKNFTAPFFSYPMGETIYNVVNLGTSHGEVGFDWKNIKEKSIKGLNLGLSGKSLNYDYFLSDYYKQNISENAIILLPISFHTLCMEGESYSPIDSIYNVRFPLLGMVRLNNLWDLISYPRNYPDDNFNESFRENSILPSDCDREIINNSIKYIEKILDLHPNVILITTPYYYEAFADDSYFIEFYRQINEISQDLNISYFDYSRDTRFHSKSYFYDTSHLNSLGREKFTEIVLNEIIMQFIE
jgi:hypothetical protein